jgi:hypothetical protein
LQDDKLDENEKIIIEYYDKEKLWNFLFTENEVKNKNGIL